MGVAGIAPARGRIALRDYGYASNIQLQDESTTVMMEQSTAPICPACGQPYLEGSIVCPACHARLARPFMQRPPRWFVGLLMAVIVALAIYAAITAWQVLALRNF